MGSMLDPWVDRLVQQYLKDTKFLKDEHTQIGGCILTCMLVPRWTDICISQNKNQHLTKAYQKRRMR